MINLDAVAVYSILTIVGSIVVLIALGLKAWNKIFGGSVTDQSSMGDDHGNS